MTDYLDRQARRVLEALGVLEKSGLWALLKERLEKFRKSHGGIAAFDEKDTAWLAAFRTEPAKSALRAGAVFYQLREAASRKPSRALAKEVEAFIQQTGDAHYGREAKELLKSLPK